ARIDRDNVEVANRPADLEKCAIVIGTAAKWPKARVSRPERRDTRGPQPRDAEGGAENTAPSRVSLASCFRG
ncbi:hypothetical protein, partial [Nocardia sp. NPDC003963]